MPRYAGVTVPVDELAQALRQGIPGWALNACLEAVPPVNELFTLTVVEGKIDFVLETDVVKYYTVFEALVKVCCGVPIKKDIRAVQRRFAFY